MAFHVTLARDSGFCCLRDQCPQPEESSPSPASPRRRGSPPLLPAFVSPLCLSPQWAGQGGRQSCGEVRGLVVSLATPRWALQVSVTCHGKLLRIELLKYDTSLKHRLLCSLLKTSAQQLQRLPPAALEYLFPSGLSPSTARGKGASATRPSDRKPGCRRPAGPHSWGVLGDVPCTVPPATAPLRVLRTRLCEPAWLVPEARGLR